MDSFSIVVEWIVLISNRYEDEKVIQALEIVVKETGLPFVSYT